MGVSCIHQSSQDASAALGVDSWQIPDHACQNQRLATSRIPALPSPIYWPGSPQQVSDRSIDTAWPRPSVGIPATVHAASAGTSTFEEPVWRTDHLSMRTIGNPDKIVFRVTLRFVRCVRVVSPRWRGVETRKTDTTGSNCPGNRLGNRIGHKPSKHIRRLEY